VVIRCLQRMDVATKARAEGAALLAKSVSCLCCLHLTRRGTNEGAGFAVTAFGISQLVYALTFTTIMYRKAMSSEGGIRWPRRVRPTTNAKNPYREEDSKATTNPIAFASSNLDLRSLRLALAFTLQGLLKHALTEADRIVLSALAGSYDQGVYALASSYGGLAARMILQTVEENARLLFSRQGALAAAARERRRRRRNAESNIEEKEKVEGSKTKERDDPLAELERTHLTLLRLVLYVGLLFASFGTNYAPVLLRALAGERWGANAEASAALSAFCVYTAFLALNGIAEAFVYGVARSGADVGGIGAAHAVAGGVFAAVAPGLVNEYGAAGLVAANCVSMALRAAYSLWYARGYFARGGRSRSVPSMLSRL